MGNVRLVGPLLAATVAFAVGCVQDRALVQFDFAPGGEGDLGFVEAFDSGTDLAEVSDLEGEVVCVADCGGKECGDDGCWGSCGTCPQAAPLCQNGKCCAPDCAGKECGDDGCGGNCGQCPTAAPICQDGSCCAPDCVGKECGDDGCKGSCGTCGEPSTCIDGQCICQPTCAGKECGGDGCGGSCGECSSGMVCQENLCMCSSHDAVACCSEQSSVCWYDSCGNVEEKITECPFGCEDGECTQCVPDCEGKECGNDGCGGTCGTCYDGQTCVAGECVEPVQIGDPCSENMECPSGFCVHSSEGKVCTQACIDDCPPGWACLQVEPALPDELYICLPENVFLCMPCNDHDQCHSEYADNGELCISDGDNGSFCGVDCDADGQCPDGYVCTEVDNGPVLAHQCVPISAECECAPKFVEAGAWTECEESNGHGTCYGERKCNADGLADCDAQVPGPEECNEIDDNCDGEVDPPNSAKCVTYYFDNDGDGYGIGAGECLCEPYSENQVTLPGDCNDANVGVNPAIAEACNYVDDDCDGLADEAGAEGCETVYYDGDHDGYGDASQTDCLCKETDDYAFEAGDCDDSDPLSNPGADEVCDAADNNCDAVIDEENSFGCTPYYLDQDKDGYGLADQLKCLCDKIGDYSAIKGGDCDDADYDIHPTTVELCDALDNDCDGQADEGEAVQSCGEIGHGTVACDGGCVIASCDGGFVDLNTAFEDGCECEVEPDEVPDQGCTDSLFVGDMPDSGSLTSKTGKIVPAEDNDWFRFQAIDAMDMDDCDTFHVTVRFLKNPNDAYLFDVWAGGCTGMGNVCAETTYFEFFTDFHEDTAIDGSIGGECKCKPDANHTLTPPIEAETTCLKWSDPALCPNGEYHVDGSCVSQCNPSCTGKECGDDGCSGSCGQCSGGEVCKHGQCVCQPQCAGNKCGDDACGGTCGACFGNTICELGNCECIPVCAGKECGDDGCEGTCGSCGAGEDCVNGTCVGGCQDECMPDSVSCRGNGVVACGEFDDDSCLDWSPAELCPAGESCLQGECVCQPNCTGKECSDDGCGGNCGSCASGNVCEYGHCICKPDCIGKECGDDGCGGSCGTCVGDAYCQGGTCKCPTTCAGKECGYDGCGEKCGDCKGQELCNNGACSHACVSDGGCTAAGLEKPLEDLKGYQVCTENDMTLHVSNDFDDTSDTAHQCTDNTTVFYVRVYRNPAAPVVCDEYEVEFSNATAD